MHLGNLIACKFICKLSVSDQYTINIWAVLSLWLNILLLLGVLKTFLHTEHSLFCVFATVEHFLHKVYIHSFWKPWFQVFLITVLSCLHQNTLLAWKKLTNCIKELYRIQAHWRILSFNFRYSTLL